MTKTITNNPCIKCGTQRIVVKTWTEKIGSSIATMEEMVCPNPACQKEVDLENQRQSDRRQLVKQKNEERINKLKHPAGAIVKNP